jgi:hypothetical protein
MPMNRVQRFFFKTPPSVVTALAFALSFLVMLLVFVGCSSLPYEPPPFGPNGLNAPRGFSAEDAVHSPDIIVATPDLQWLYDRDRGNVQQDKEDLLLLPWLFQPTGDSSATTDDLPVEEDTQANTDDGSDYAGGEDEGTDEASNDTTDTADAGLDSQFHGGLPPVPLP